MTCVRAAVLVEAFKKLEVEELEIGTVAADEVLVRVTASGVCHSDLTLTTMSDHPTPVILGHEGAGVVEAVGSNVTSVRRGDRVISTFSPGCGDCWYCRRDMGRHCERSFDAWYTPRMKRLDGTPVLSMTGLGTFAEAMRVTERSVVKVETDLPDEALALIGCGVTTGVGAALNTANVQPGSTVAIIGCGGVGISAVQGAAIAGATVIIAVDPVALKREIALTLGATASVDPSGCDAVEAVRELTGGRGVDYAIDAIGYASTAAQACAMTRKAGTAVIVGLSGLGESMSIPLGNCATQEKRILGSFYGSSESRREFHRIVSLVEQGKLDIAPMVSRHFHLDQVDDAFRAMQAGEVIRSVITF